jgi:hypothetical protein
MKSIHNHAGVITFGMEAVGLGLEALIFAMRMLYGGCEMIRAYSTYIQPEITISAMA